MGKATKTKFALTGGLLAVVVALSGCSSKTASVERTAAADSWSTYISQLEVVAANCEGKKDNSLASGLSLKVKFKNISDKTITSISIKGSLEDGSGKEQLPFEVIAGREISAGSQDEVGIYNCDGLVDIPWDSDFKIEFEAKPDTTFDFSKSVGTARVTEIQFGGKVTERIIFNE